MNDVKALCDAPPNIPGLVQFLGAYHVPESGQVSIVLDYMDGGSLGDVLQKVKKIPENVLSKVTASVLHGLAHLHRKSHMVHRDIKPANILVNLDGEPKITDFGISAFIDNTLAVVRAKRRSVSCICIWLYERGSISVIFNSFLRNVK
jgi:serine/threonine protein kinase